MVGPVGAVTALVLQFNQPLDPSTANNIKAYHIGRNFGSSDSGGGFDPIGFLEQHKPISDPTILSPELHRKAAKASSPVLHPDASVGTVSYDDTTDTVTISAQKPFQSNAFLRFIRVAGTGPNTIKGANGLALDGNRSGHPGSNDVIRYRFFRNKSMSYTDPLGSHVTLKLSGPGEILAFLPKQKNPEPIVFLSNTDPTASILTGTVKFSKHASGTTTLQELSGLNEAQVELGPQFVITNSQF